MEIFERFSYNNPNKNGNRLGKTRRLKEYEEKSGKYHDGNGNGSRSSGRLTAETAVIHKRRKKRKKRKQKKKRQMQLQAVLIPVDRKMQRLF